ncbi:STAS-like domain-containing protein [Myxococcota bacterium]
MPRRGNTDRIRRFILENVSDYPADIVSRAVSEFGISRQAIHRHVGKLVSEGLLTATGKTRSRRYKLKILLAEQFFVDVAPNLSEDKLWREKVKPLLGDLPVNVMDICHYGFSEMVNNVIEHSEGTTVVMSAELNAATVELNVFDNGIGIFKKLKDELDLDDERHAILELAKGKLTTDPARHTGEGIFFTSRLFDEYSILSGRLCFLHSESDRDWLIERADSKTKGTKIFMSISMRSRRTTKAVFDRYSAKDGDYGFTRTRVPVALARYGDESLVSRSQARRVLARFDRFKEVLLDFRGVKSIGQAFADEIFRVYRYEHPEVELTWIRENKEVRGMILRAWTAAKDS